MKLLNWIKTSLCVIATIAVLSACGGGGSSSTTPDATTTSLKIVVQNEAGSPVSAARVRVAGADMTTDATGAVSTTLPNSDTETVALITKAGFATNAKTAVVFSGKASELQVTLFEHQVFSSFASNAGVIVNPGGATVQIPATAGFRTGAGVAYTGTVTISSSYFNPETVRGINGFAGPYIGSDAGVSSSLISVGVIEAKFTAADGTALEMTNAAAATLTFPATGNSGTLTSVPLWYYDEVTKIWVREGQAARQADGSYVGTVRHFTVWNADISVANPATIKGCYRDAQGRPIPQVYARIVGIGWSASGGVGADGNFEVRNAPSGRPLELQTLITPAASPVAITPLAAGEVRQLACVVLAGPPTAIVIPPSGNFPGITITVPILTPTTPNVTPTTPSTTASFAGTYIGTYSGAENGTFNVVITSAGVVAGSAFSQTFQGLVSGVSGQVGSNGQVSLTATGQAGSANFSGSISAAGIVSGTWAYVGGGGSGTFTGQRQMSLANTALLAQYVGTWRDVCYALGSASTDELFTISTPTSASARAVSTSRYYASSNCSGNPIATITESGISFVANGTKTVGTQVVVKIDVILVGGTPTFTGSASLGLVGADRAVSVTLNGTVIETQAYLLTALTGKTIFSQPGAGNTFTTGQFNGTTPGTLAPLDENGYPQSLDTTTPATRQ